MFIEPLNSIKNQTKESGHAHIDELLKNVVVIDGAYAKNDTLRILDIQRQNLNSMRQLTPHFRSLMLLFLNHFVGNHLENIVTKSDDNRIAINDINHFLKLTAAVVKDI